MPPKNKIVTLKLEDYARRLRREGGKGGSDREIASQLSKVCGKSISHMTVNRYFENHPLMDDVVTILEKTNPEAIQAAAEYIQESVTTLKQINDAITDLEQKSKEAKDKNDNFFYLKIMKELIRYYDLKAKLMGEIGPAKSLINNNNTQNNVLIYIPANGRD